MKTKLSSLTISILLSLPLSIFAQTGMTTLPMFILKSFRGASDHSKVSLNWDLTSSEGLKNIIVERSSNLKDFQVIRQFEIIDENKKYYTHTDESVQTDVVYYRLRFVSKEGKFSLSKVLIFQTSRQVDESSLNLFPSVFRNDLTLRMRSEKSGKAMFRITNFSGKVIYSREMHVQTGNNSFIIDEAFKLPAGNYIATLEAAGKISSQQIVKQ
jgi:hypothetical protein